MSGSQVDATRDQVVDNRKPSWGLGRVVMALFWLFGVWTTVVAIRDLFSLDGSPEGPAVLALIAGVIYLLAAAAITHNGRRMRMIGWATIGIELVGPLMCGVLSVGVPQLVIGGAWGEFGHEFFYLPLPLGVIGLVWMWWSNPRRIVELAEQVERPLSSRFRSPV